MLTEKNVPNDPAKWDYYVDKARDKYKVYPSAYANAYASKEYKEAGGTWRKSKKNEELEEMKDNPCWEGYDMVGTKMKNGKEVPNCVKRNESEEVEEQNTTAGGGGEYQTPNAFAGGSKKWKKRMPKGYTEPSLYYERILNTIENLMNEISYNEFKSDTSSNHKQKINNSIKEISSQLYKMEQTLNQISKLKTEINGDQRIFYKSTFSKFGKISERILRLGNKIRELSK